LTPASPEVYKKTKPPVGALTPETGGFTRKFQMTIQSQDKCVKSTDEGELPLFEYLYFEVDVPDELQNELDHQAKFGWRLISVCCQSGSLVAAMERQVVQ
jgi:hypothetical protein